MDPLTTAPHRPVSDCLYHFRHISRLLTASVHLQGPVFMLLVNIPVISELLVNYKKGTCLHQPPVKVSRTLLRE